MNFKDLKKNFEIDLEVNLISPITAKQGDTARYLSFELYNNGQALDLTGKTVKIFAKKPDNTEVFNDCTIEDNKVIVALTSQLLAVEGIAKCELMLLDENKNYITSKVFDLKIERAVNSDTAIKSTNEYGTIVSLISDLEQGKKDIKVIGSIHDTMLNTIDVATDLHHNLKVSMNTATDTNKTLTNTINTANTTIANVEKADSDAQKTADGLNAAIEKVGDTDLILQGDYEVGKNGTLKDISKQDIKSINKSGRYKGANVKNAPDGADWYYFDVVVHQAEQWKSVIAKSLYDNTIYSMTYRAGVWSNWEKVYTTSNKPTVPEIQQQYKTTDSGPNNAGKWTQFASFNCKRQYEETDMELNIIGYGSANQTPSHGKLIFKLRQQLAMGTAPKCSLYLTEAINIKKENIKLVITNNTSTVTEGQLWISPPMGYETIKFMPQYIQGNITFLENQPYVNKLPAGTVIDTKMLVDLTPAEIGAISTSAYEVGTDGTLKDISNQDLLTITKSGRYKGANCLNAVDSYWYFYDIENTYYMDSRYTRITARRISSDITYTRVNNGGTWSNWERVYNSGDWWNFTSKNPTGYQKLPSGLIIQWGSVGINCNINRSSSADITLPIAFPNKCVATFANANFNNNLNTTDYMDGVLVNSSMKGTLNKISVFIHNLAEVKFPNDPTTVVTNWVAIGY